MTTNRRLVLAQRPHGLLAEGDVRLEKVALPDLEEGEALMRTTYLLDRPDGADLGLRGSQLLPTRADR